MIKRQPRQAAEYAEPVIGPATSGRTRWLFRLTRYVRRRATVQPGQGQ
jgi:hypothetical protein